MVLYYIASNYYVCEQAKWNAHTKVNKQIFRKSVVSDPSIPERSTKLENLYF